MAAITGTIATVAGALGSLGTAYSSVKGIEAQEKAQRQQADMMEEQQKMQADEIARQQQESLAKRKAAIDDQRKQMLGAGDTAYGINQTSDAGADMASGSLLGVGLG